MSEVPVLCAPCLGSKEHVKMMRHPLGETCKMCTRPFTAFRWTTIGEHRQSKKTIVCQTCAETRNCCQSCILDVDFRMPLDIRDAALKVSGMANPYAMEETTRNAEVRAIKADKMESQLKTKKGTPEDIKEKRAKAKAFLETLASKLPGSFSQRPKVKDLEVSHKELSKTIGKLPFGGTSDAPEDTALKSFFVFGFSSQTPQYTLTDFFGKYGTLAQVKIVHQARCGFITFSKRSAAEECAEFLRQNRLSKNAKTAALIVLGNEPVRICWGAPKNIGNTKEEERKIATVVNKVMKQLADKDASVSAVQGKTGGRKKQQGSGTGDKEKSAGNLNESAKKQYKSMANDFEA